MSKQNDLKSSPKQVQKPSQAQWYVYLIRAANQALYCGITTEPQRRLLQHQAGKGARFFHSSPAQAVVYLEECADKSAALKREHRIKQLGKPQKEALLEACSNSLVKQA